MRMIKPKFGNIHNNRGGFGVSRDVDNQYLK